MSENQSILINCPKCQKPCRVKRELAGKRVRCPNPACGSAIEVQEPAKTNGPPAIVPLPPTNPGRGQDGHQATNRERPADIADQLHKLHQLHVSGALSAEEFAKAKQACLDQVIPKAPTPQHPKRDDLVERKEEIVQAEAVEEEVVETQAVTRDGNRRPKPPPLPRSPTARQVQYRAADFKDLYMKFLMKYLAVVSLNVIFGFIVVIDPQFVRAHIWTYVAAVISGMIIVTVLSGIFLYRAWAQIQDGRPRTTPGKAVGFRFIPFFSFYWEFVAVKGLAEDIEDYARARRIAIDPIPRFLTITYCVLVIVAGTLSAVPILGPILLLPLAAAMLLLFKKIADASAAIAEDKQPAVAVAAAVPAKDGTVETAVGIVTAVTAGLAVVEKLVDPGHH